MPSTKCVHRPKTESYQHQECGYKQVQPNARSGAKWNNLNRIINSLMIMKDKKEKVEEFYDKIAEEYDQLYEGPYWRLYHEITWQNIKNFFP